MSHVHWVGPSRQKALQPCAVLSIGGTIKTKKTQTVIGWVRFRSGGQMEEEKEQCLRSYAIISSIYLVTINLPIALGQLTAPFFPKTAIATLKFRILTKAEGPPSLHKTHESSFQRWKKLGCSCWKSKPRSSSFGGIPHSHPPPGEPCSLQRPFNLTSTRSCPWLILAQVKKAGFLTLCSLNSKGYKQDEPLRKREREEERQKDGKGKEEKGKEREEQQESC